MFKFIVGAACLLFLIGGGSVIGSLGSKVNHDQKTSDRVAANWDQITVGMSESEVTDLIGEPDDKSTSTSSDFEGGTTTMDIWEYGTLADTTYSITFSDGTVEDKSTL
jgi:hypothetical protein